MNIKRSYFIVAAILLAVVCLKEDTVWFLAWWMVLLGLGLIFLPFTSLVFSGFRGGGYFFSKIIGLAIAGYITWMFAMIKTLPFTAWSAYLVLALCLYVNVVISRKTDTWRRLFKDDGMRHILDQETIFMLALLFWSYLRGLKPEIIGLEKFMDFGFMNSILRGTFFPPLDMWFASEPINYYYLGHYYAAYLTRISFAPPQISYNLMMASLFAISFMAAFNIGVCLTGICNEFSSDNAMIRQGGTFCGFLSGALVTLSGSLHTPIYAWFINRFGKEPYWFPDATRYIGINPPVQNDATIHEFPLYSYVVSDMHAHALNMIFVLTAIAVSAAVGVKIIRRAADSGKTEGNDSFRDYIPGAG
ncbi:MAG: DUF2298 domain-containing protein, partial [Clostridiales bacterium]|nr:DUF2298 domain-containing protein [Clostridiales bacterium]